MLRFATEERATTKIAEAINCDIEIAKEILGAIKESASFKGLESLLKDKGEDILAFLKEAQSPEGLLTFGEIQALYGIDENELDDEIGQEWDSLGYHLEMTLEEALEEFESQTEFFQ